MGNRPTPHSKEPGGGLREFVPAQRSVDRPPRMAEEGAWLNQCWLRELSDGLLPAVTKGRGNSDIASATYVERAWFSIRDPHDGRSNDPHAECGCL